MEGRVDLRTTVASRLEYGLTAPRWSRDAGVWSVHVGPVGLRLTSDDELTAQEGSLSGAFSVGAGERAGFCLAYAPPYEADDGLDIDAEHGLPDTVAAWRSWAAEHRATGAGTWRRCAAAPWSCRG